MTGGLDFMTGGPKALTDGLQNTSVTGGPGFCYSPDSKVALQPRIPMTYGITFLVCLTSFFALMSKRTFIFHTQHGYTLSL
jgi:hypothetical protein